MTPILKIETETEYQQALQSAAEVLKKGGVAAIPTDTVYGFAALVHDPAAIGRLYEIKERSQMKSIAVLLGDAEQADQVAKDFPPKARRLAAKYWPGALTVIIAKREGLPADLTSNDLVGLRVPDCEFARDLMRLTGPLATTSANLSGMPPAKNISEFTELYDRLDLIIDGGQVRGGVPSSVVRCDCEPAQVLREGAIPAEELLKC